MFYLLPATEPESPLLRASSPTMPQPPRAQSDLPSSLLPNTPLVELSREHVIAMPEMPGESLHLTLTLTPTLTQPQP